MPSKKSENSAPETPKKPHFVKREAIDFGFNAAKKNIVFFFSIFVVWALVTIISSSVQGALNADKQSLASFLFSLLVWIVSSVISMGIINISLEFVDKKKPVLKDLYYTKKIFNFILVSIIRTAIVAVGFILLIVPGIIFAIKLQFAEYLIVDKKLDAVDSLKGSWEMTKGVKWNLFLFGLLLALINVLGFLALIVGLVITVPLSMVATAFVYRKLLSQTNLK